MVSSMLAGACASTLTNPLDMAKLRMQVMRAGHTGGGAPQSEQYYRHMLDGVYKIARDEGGLALFSGSLARIMFHVPNVAITMSLVEVIKPRISNFLSGDQTTPKE
jgi:Mitochondrial carrier protein